MFRHVLFGAYFAKYMLSDAPSAANGKRLPAFFLQQLADHIPFITSRPIETWDTTMVQYMDQAAITLRVLLDYQDGCPHFEPLSAEASALLAPNLRTWGRYYRENGNDTWNAFAMAAKILEGDPSCVENARKMVDSLERLQKCARKGCSATQNLMQCARCRTVLYCGPRHQAQHWRDPDQPHKLHCHPTTF